MTAPTPEQLAAALVRVDIDDGSVMEVDGRMLLLEQDENDILPAANALRDAFAREIAAAEARGRVAGLRQGLAIIVHNDVRGLPREARDSLAGYVGDALDAALTASP